MRLRYRAVDWFDEASREESLRRALPIPAVTSLEERFDALSKLDGSVSSCHRNLIINSSSPKIFPELLQDFSCVGETSIYDKFLSQIFPGVLQLCRPSIDPRAGVLTLSESMYDWFSSDVQCELQFQEGDANNTYNGSHRNQGSEVQEDDVNMTCSASQRIDPCEIHEKLGEKDVNRNCSKRLQEADAIVTYSKRIRSSQIHQITPKSIIYDNAPYASSGSGKSTFGSHVKEQKRPKATTSDFQEIELLELRSCIPQPEHVSLLSPCQHWSKIILELGAAPLTAPDAEEEAAFKVKIPEAWFDISAIPCSPKRCFETDSKTVEARLHGIQTLRQIDEACDSQDRPHKMSNPLVKVTPIEIFMIPEKLYLLPVTQKEMNYPLKPNCLLQWFEANGDNMVEKEAENLVMGDFTTEITAVDFVATKLAYHDEYPRPEILPSDLLRDGRDPRPCCTSVLGSAMIYPFDTKFTFEIPIVCEWSFASLANRNPGIIAADESETPVPDLERLRPSQSFDSSVVIPELSLDDDQFQSLPVPVVTGPHDDLIDALRLEGLMSSNCEPSTFPATHWLYLDWHFLHGLKCTNAVCFSLRAQLTDDARCAPLPPTLVTRDVVTSQKCSELALEVRLLEDQLAFHRDFCPNSHATGTRGGQNEAFLPSPLPGVPQTRGNEPFLAQMDTHNSKERAYKPLLRTPAVNIPTGVDMATTNGFLPARHASNLLHKQCSPGSEDQTVDLQIQAQKSCTNPVTDSKQSRYLQSLLSVESLGKRKPDSLRNMNADADSLCNFQEREPSSDPIRKGDRSPTSIRNGSDFMESDLDFFVQARKGTLGTSCNEQMTKASKENISNAVHELQHIYTSEPALSDTRESNEQDHDTTHAAPPCVHQIELSLEIRKGLVSLSSNYRALLALEEMLELKSGGDMKVLEQFGFDDDGNSTLTSLISDMASEPASHQRQTQLRGLISLHVLRHTALNLCEYGIQVAHLYLENCFERMQFLEGYVMDSRTELEEAYNHVERGAVEDHPKLCYLDKLLRVESLEINLVKNCSRRILLLADRRAFFSVVRKLVSLGLTPYQIDRKESYLQNGVLQEDHIEKLKEEIVEALAFSDCLLVSYAYMIPIFPVQRFTMIIHYADPPSFDTTDSNWTRGRCETHVFKLLVHPEDFQETCSSNSSLRQASHYQDPQAHSPLVQPSTALGRCTNQPTGQSSSSNKNVRLIENEPAIGSFSVGAREEQLLVEETGSLDRRCEMIIVANISHPNDHLLTGRRSSFLKVLNLEKENVQVVERELRLPVDLILSPASCLLIYTLGKLNLEAHSLQNKQMALQNEVVTHLKAISFSFRDCIMIFEGPTEFTTLSLDIFTHIYALAISLEIQFQCFASRHQEVTDRIVMQSIQAVRRSRRMLSCPLMTEGPTLAEVFLTEFPSINPLAAHAILSSGCALPVFMSYASEQQFAAVEEYEVPKHCLDLFKAQCTYKAIAIKKNVVSDYRVAKSQPHGSDEEETPYLQQADPQSVSLSDYRVAKSQLHRPDEETPYLHQADPQAVSIPHQSQASEVWASFPEFPPATAFSDYAPAFNVNNTHKVSDYSPAYNIGNTHKMSEYPSAYNVRMAPPAYSTHKIRENSPAYNVGMAAHQMSSFPDFPPISEVRDCDVEDPREKEPSSTDLYEILDTFKHSPAAPLGTNSARWSHTSEADDASMYEEGATAQNNNTRGGLQHPQEMYVQDEIQWSGKGLGSAGLGSASHLYGAQNNRHLPQNSSSAAQYEVEDHSFGLERRVWPRETSPPPMERSGKRLREGPERVHGQYEILLKSGADMIPGLGGISRPQKRSRPTMDDVGSLGAKRGASSFSSISPTVYGSREEITGFDTALGSWNDHKRVRGVAGGFMNEAFDLLQGDNNDSDRFTSKLAAFPACDLDESSAVQADWMDNTLPEEASFMSISKNQHPKTPQATPTTTTLRASSLDRFRHQTRRAAGAPGTPSNNYAKAKIKFPRKPAPPRSRKQSPSVTYSRPAPVAKAAAARKALSDNIAVDRRSKAILGYTRRGSDAQQCLVWKTNPSSASSKRQGIDVLR